MRITIPQPQLLRHLQMVEHAVNDRSTLPILANILIETTEEGITLSATDLDVGIRCRFPLAAQNEKGAVALPARKFTTVIRELPDEVVVLEARKNHTATITCGASSFRIPGLPAEDFPILPPTSNNEQLTISQQALKTLIAQTAHAMSMEETRFILNGTLIALQKTELTLVATDGRRLAAAKAPVTNATTHQLSVVVPAKTVRELGRLLQADGTEEVRIAPLKDNQLTFTFGDVTIITRLIEGQFPQYDKVIPPPTKTVMTCNRQTLTNAIRRASLMTSAASQAVVFEVGEGKLVVSKESAELGSAREELAVTYPGEPVTVAFNPEFWLEVLKVLDTDEVAVEITGPEKPAVIRQPGFTYLVLPMKAV
ncbi:MAG: DNA polymerase III subunit beta [Candidatus Omnitrophica bacterium]|nr:DNA polymerase III subunit beta [Candidatus Omnitrophota bacterium]